MEFAVYSTETHKRVSDIYETEREAIDARNAMERRPWAIGTLYVDAFPYRPVSGFDYVI